jgi:RNA polymerase sigma-70 factor, ECF subfamily
MTDAGNDSLLNGLAAGDERAFSALYDQFGERLFRAAYGILGRREDAQDAVQEVFTALVQARKSLAGVNDMAAYLFSALRRAAARRAGRRKREPALLDSVSDVAAKAEPSGTDHPRAERLEKALQCLPHEQREVILLKTDGGLTFAQIAEVLGISPNTAASRYRYALEKLREVLRD